MHHCTKLRVQCNSLVFLLFRKLIINSDARQQASKLSILLINTKTNYQNTKTRNLDCDFVDSNSIANETDLL